MGAHISCDFKFYKNEYEINLKTKTRLMQLLYTYKTFEPYDS